MLLYVPPPLIKYQCQSRNCVIIVMFQLAIHYFHLNVMTAWLPPFFHLVRPKLNLGIKTGYPDEIYNDFHQPLQMNVKRIHYIK